MRTTATSFARSGDRAGQTWRTSAPVPWSTTCIVWRERVHGHPAADRALAAYGPHDAELLEVLIPALGVFLAAWTIVIARRRPSAAAVAYLDQRLGYVRNLAQTGDA
jgi:hypothetical protein